MKRLVAFAALAASAAAAAFACDLTDGLTGGPDDAGDAGDACQDGACGCGACPEGPNAVGACVDGGCALVCLGSFGDCDEAGANGCETNLAASRTSCGRCGHDCLGGACTAGVCQPVVVTQNADSPAHIVADETNIYGVNAFGTVSRIRKASGALAPLAVGGQIAQDPPGRIALANASLYWTSMADGGSGVYAIGIEGGKPTLLAAAQAPFAIAASATTQTLYWSEGDPLAPSPTGTIKSCKLPGCATEEVVVPTAPGAITSIDVRAGTLYWANNGTPPTYADGAVNACKVGSCSPAPLATKPARPLNIVTDATTAYWTTSTGDVASCFLAGCSNEATLVDTFQYLPQFVAPSGTQLFFTCRDGTVKSVAKGGTASSERTLYQSRGAWPFAIIADPTVLYWTDLAGAPGTSRTTLFKLAR